jgi:two-component system, cell cycle response regulator
MAVWSSTWPPERMPNASKQRVLIVDDSKIVRTTIARLIRTSFDVREEPDGEAGWAALEADPSIAVVISDLHMPKLDGFGLIEKIRGASNGRIKDMPVIMISGNEDDATKKKARAAGANDFITKSTDGTEILSRIDNLLRLVQTKQDLHASQEALANTVIRDPLTGTFTPQYLATEGAKHFSHARRHGSALSAIAFRIESHAENVQKVGKDVADQLLARVAKLVLKNLRTEDSMGRTGEASFMVISPSTSAQQAVAFAKRLRDQLEAAKVNFRDHVLRMRTSVGIASLGHDSAASIEELMKAAVQRLERAAQGAPSVADPQEAPPPPPPPEKPAGLPPEIEKAVETLEYANVERLGDNSAEVLRRVLPFLHAACRRLQIELPVDQILKALKGRR